MKMMTTGVMVATGIAAGMVAGAYLTMSKPCVRRIYRYGKRATKKMFNMWYGASAPTYKELLWTRKR